MNPLREKILSLAQSQLGKPYEQDTRFDCKKPDQEHFDCSSLVQWSYFQGANILLPRTAHEQFDVTVPVDDPKPGDLGFFKDADRGVYHVGLFFDDVKVIEARSKDSSASFVTGKVIYRPVVVWREYRNFTGWRTFPALDAQA